MVIYKYRYSIRNIVITLDKNYELMDGSISYLFIQHDYALRRLPVIRAHVELEIPLIALIYKLKDKAKIKFDLYEQQLDEDGKKVLNTTLYWQHSFTIVPAMDQTNYITATDSETLELVDDMRKMQIFDMYLMDMDAVKWFTKQMDPVFQDASKPAALHALLQMRGVPGGITIATPPLGNEILKYMTLPLGDLVGNIDTLNTAYGLYDSYPIIYYDLINMYCINRMNPNIILPSVTDFGTVTMILQNAVTPDYQVCGSCNDPGTKTHFINLNQVPTINDYTPNISSTKFATVASVDSEGNVAKQTLDGSATALAYVYSMNDMTVPQAVNEVIKGRQVSINVNSCAVSFLKPYKLYNFSTDTQYENLKLRGKVFRITNWGVSISRETVGTDPTYVHEVTINLTEPSVTT